MKRIHSLPDPILAGHIEAVLREAGIGCLVKNKHLAGGIGELPANEVWPEIWVLEDRDAERATALIEALASAPEPQAEPWRCPRCDERIEPQFTACWRCASPSPEGTLKA